jgi:multidrug efflux pump subunit AcrA (membrane-fusion protein)
MKKVLVVLSLFALPVLFAACSSASSKDTSSAAAAPAPPAISVESGRIESRELQRMVEAIGTLDPNEEVTISNQVEGAVSKVLVDLGDFVKAGQVLATLDTRELELQVRQQEAALQQEMARVGITDPNANLDESSTSQVKQAEATLSEARTRLDRIKKLTNEGVLPKQELDAQQAKFDVAEASVKSARESVRNIRATVAARKAALEFAQKKLSDARVTAPISGLVKERLVSEGTYLKANSPVVTLVQSSPLKLHLDVPETAIASVQNGRPVQFTVDSIPGKTFAGKIARLSPSVNQQSRTLKLEALVDNGNGALKPGLFARVTIFTGKSDKALVAPPAALFEVAGLEKLFVIEQGKVAERIVRTGSRGTDYVEVVEGVKEGDVVATSNLGSLQQGREVSTR